MACHWAPPLLGARVPTVVGDIYSYSWCHVQCVSEYAPTQQHAADRTVFFEDGDGLSARLPAGGHVLAGGDWNGHFGKDAAGWDW
eukprot:6007258-Pyramimonas_sp.AAC.1